MKIDSKINLELTQESGQTSQPPWKKIAKYYCDVVFVDDHPILIKLLQNDINNLTIDYEVPISDPNLNIDEKSILFEISKIFDLNFNLNDFYSYLEDDSKLKPAIDFCNGLRLFLAKDPFESVISSIISANNSIARWTKSVHEIKKKWGISFDFPSGTFYGFPSPEKLMNVYENDLKEFDECSKIKELDKCINNLKSCGVGYRANYIKKASKLFTLEMDLYDIQNMNYDEAYERMLAIPGVGPKVADCILLYAFGMNEAFPTDVWIKRIVSHLYFNDKDISVSKVREFGMERFGDYAGYAQLYLFHYARKSGLMKKLK